MGGTSQPDSYLATEHVRALLDTMDRGIVIANRKGEVLLLNERARKCLEERGIHGNSPLNLFQDVMNADAKEISRRLLAGEHEIELKRVVNGNTCRASLRWIPQSDWLTIQIANEDKHAYGSAAPNQPTVQELLQERAITYRNLL